jgi:heme/copper-type cytochrome/quinol oxidase subunit 2
MKKINYILFVVLSLFSLAAVSQTANENQPQMADEFRNSGKIYIVIMVISIIFICLIAYLVFLDLKLRKLENKKSNSQNALR